MVDVHVYFSFMQKEWTHRFHVEKGTTVHMLKGLMLKSRGTPVDLAAFELRRGYTNMLDSDTIECNETLGFHFLSDRAKMRRAADAPPLHEAADAPAQVEVTVRHAKAEKQSSIKVWVSADATVGEVRGEVMAALSEQRPSEVKLVTTGTGQTFVSLHNSERIGGRREFLSLGRSLDAPAHRAGQAPPTLTEEHALQLQRELLDGFASESFQRELAAAEREYGRNAKFALKRQELALGVQKHVLPRYGFEGNGRGVVAMMKAMDAHSAKLAKLREGGQRIDELLKNRGPMPQVQVDKHWQNSAEIVITVQWDASDPSKEAVMPLPRGVTSFNVKEALCKGDPTGQARPEHFFLASEKRPDQPLDDGLVISEALGKLKLLPWEMVHS